MTLTEFLLARVAEDEALAERSVQIGDKCVALISFGTPHAAPVLIVHPERVLAECAAKRRIITRHMPEEGVEPWMTPEDIADLTPQERDGYCRWCTYDARTVWAPCADLRDLAVGYADHPDYQPEWRPALPLHLPS